MHDPFDDFSILPDLTGSGGKPDPGKADLIGSDATPGPESRSRQRVSKNGADPEGTAPLI